VIGVRLAAGRCRESGQVVVEPGYRQQALHARGHGDEPEPFWQVLYPAGGSGQRSQAGCVHESHLTQVNDYPGDGLFRCPG